MCIFFRVSFPRGAETKYWNMLRGGGEVCVYIKQGLKFLRGGQIHTTLPPLINETLFRKETQKLW